MDRDVERQIIDILQAGRDMTIATVREDGYPQATAVSYVSDGLAIYFGCDADSQKAQNIARDDRVSLAITLPYAAWEDIRGLSLGGRAQALSDPAEVERIGRLMLRKFPELADYGVTGWEGVVLIRVVPEVVSILDYRKGFGHTDLVRV